MAEDSGDKKEEVLNAPPSQDDIEKAECLKADANKFFKDEKYQQAVDLYTQVKQHSLCMEISSYEGFNCRGSISRLISEIIFCLSSIVSSIRLIIDRVGSNTFHISAFGHLFLNIMKLCL